MTPGPDDDSAKRAPTSGREVEELFTAHTGLADRLARRYSSRNILDEDLQQVAHIALLLACRRFDPEKGRFIAFAATTIVGELKKHLRTHGWSVHVPRSLQEDSITVAAAIDRLTGKLGRNPRVSEICEHTGLTAEKVADASRAQQARFRKPLDHAGTDGGLTNDVADSALLNDALNALDPDARAIISMRFDEGLTQREIGERLGVSQPQVHRRLTAALRQLEHRLDDHDGTAP